MCLSPLDDGEDEADGEMGDLPKSARVEKGRQNFALYLRDEENDEVGQEWEGIAAKVSLLGLQRSRSLRESRRLAIPM